jgi:hypothetical protein
VADDPRDVEPPTVERHEAVDRFGKRALRTAHDLGAALAETGHGEPGEPVVVRTDGPHRTIDGLAALIDAALEDAPSDGTGSVPDERRDHDGGQQHRRRG